MESERDRLILEHLPQVRAIARFIHSRLPRNILLDDLVSTGVLGLISAVDNFDPARNAKLNTYADFRIRGAIWDMLRESYWPRRKRNLYTEIAGEEGELLLKRLASTEPPASVVAERNEASEMVARFMTGIPTREQTVLDLYYLEEMTLEQIGAAMGCSYGLVSQIKTRAVLRLRVCMEMADS